MTHPHTQPSRARKGDEEKTHTQLHTGRHMHIWQHTEIKHLHESYVFVYALE